MRRAGICFHPTVRSTLEQGLEAMQRHVLLSIKDQLRSARYVVRRSATRESDRERTSFELPQPIASIANVMFSQAEAAASKLFSEREGLVESSAFPLPVTAYFGHPDEETVRRGVFTETLYNGLKVLLRKFGAREFLIFEEAIETARVELLTRHGDLIWAAIGAKDDTRREESITRLCAAMACVMYSRRPIKAVDIDFNAKTLPRHLLISPNAYCAIVIGLATAIVSLNRSGDELDEEGVVVAADMVVDARFSKFGPALRRSRDPVSAVSAIFSTVLPFLP